MEKWMYILQGARHNRVENTDWNDIIVYNPPINFCTILMATLHHLVQITGQLLGHNPRLCLKRNKASKLAEKSQLEIFVFSSLLSFCKLDIPFILSLSLSLIIVKSTLKLVKAEIIITFLHCTTFSSIVFVQTDEFSCSFRKVFSRQWDPTHSQVETGGLQNLKKERESRKS